LRIRAALEIEQGLIVNTKLPAYGIDALRADLQRFVFLLGVSDGEELFGEPTP